MAATPGYRDLAHYQNVNMSPTWLEVAADPAVVGPVGDGGRQQLLEGVVQPRTGDHHRGEDVVCLGALVSVLLSRCGDRSCVRTLATRTPHTLPPFSRMVVTLARTSTRPPALCTMLLWTGLILQTVSAHLDDGQNIERDLTAASDWVVTSTLHKVSVQSCLEMVR